MSEIRQFSDRFHRQVSELCTQYTSHLADGGAEDYADYVSTVGMIRGLKRAQEIVDELRDKVLRSGDED